MFYIEEEKIIGEVAYLKLLADVYRNGTLQESRSGYLVCDFDAKVKFNKDNPPIFRSRVINHRYSFEEFWFFLNGKTQTKELEEKGIKFWIGNTSRDFLDKRGLKNLPEGDMGKAYGYQFRNFNDTVDQLKEVYELLKNDPYTRRALVTFWNPNQINEMALPPCWHSHQFVLIGEKLNLKVFNRSLDILYGAPYAMFQYWVYLNAMAKLLGYEVGEMSCDLSHVHIYENQMDYVEEYLDHCVDNFVYEYEFWDKPNLIIDKELNNLEDLLTLKWEDIKLENVKQLKFKSKSKKPNMAV